MPVPSMHPSTWEGSHAMLNQRDMAGMRQNQGPRDVQMGGGFHQKRWAAGDDSILEQ
ncbi:unnamed protein product, partial [Candidula unifasciata]